MTRRLFPCWWDLPHRWKYEYGATKDVARQRCTRCRRWYSEVYA